MRGGGRDQPAPVRTVVESPAEGRPVVSPRRSWRDEPATPKQVAALKVVAKRVGVVEGQRDHDERRGGGRDHGGGQEARPRGLGALMRIDDPMRSKPLGSHAAAAVRRTLAGLEAAVQEIEAAPLTILPDDHLSDLMIGVRNLRALLPEEQPAQTFEDMCAAAIRHVLDMVADGGDLDRATKMLEHVADTLDWRPVAE
jgi:hypothetical protein